MSIYSYLCCTDCKVFLWLGKAVFSGVDKVKVVSLHVGPADSTPNYMNFPLSRALWEMLAAHHGHQIHTFFDYELERMPDRDLYTEIEAEDGSDESTSSQTKSNQP